mmetsp:Transcript_21939/g.52209  ORF Transcript_21939/g.52209 Transcript_21939/m.52209 type:complete len:284 (-) Transcript_21939:232-1083(-)
MGNAQPHNKTGKKVVEQKLGNARKTGILSLGDHKLESCPDPVFEISKLTTLDLSGNKLKTLDPKLANLKVLKSLNVDRNKLSPGSLAVLSSLSKLKTLSASDNQLGRPASSSGASSSSSSSRPALPANLPKGLKTILLAKNSLSGVPRSIVESNLRMLEKLDLSSNNLATVPETIADLIGLTELNLDDNVIVGLPAAVGKLTKLKVLSLRRNRLSAGDHPQPLPEELWTDTLLIDLNLHGNPMTATQLNAMDGYDAFLSRRREIKNKDILGGAMTDLDVCGLE